MHGVRGTDDHLGPGALQSVELFGQIILRVVPKPIPDEMLDIAEIDRNDHDLADVPAAVPGVEPGVE